MPVPLDERPVRPSGPPPEVRDALPWKPLSSVVAAAVATQGSRWSVVSRPGPELPAAAAVDAVTPALPPAVVAVCEPWPLLSRAEWNSFGRGVLGPPPKASNVSRNRAAPISLLLQATTGSLGLAEPNWQAVPCQWAGG